MDAFQTLVMTIERLLAPDGCSWDQEQTLQSMRKSVIEEAYELVEAIDFEDNEKIKEELGDLCLNVVFLSKIAEKEGRFSLSQVLQCITEKLIRRHPHIFEEVQKISAEQVKHQWEAIKRTEKSNHGRESAMDGIPKDLPSLARAEKMLTKFQQAQFEWQDNQIFSSQENLLAKDLLNLVQKASQNGMDAEAILRRALSLLEWQFRQLENEKNKQLKEHSKVTTPD
jgi:MazG family protein